LGEEKSRFAEGAHMTTLHRQTGPVGEFVATYVPEDVILQTARGLAAEVGLAPVAPAAGATLRLMAAASGAKAVVEIGTGTGVSGLWLLRGMRADGVLTTIDLEGEHQRMARRLFVEAGFPSSRTRVITGRALEVLPRLADGVYDLVFVDADPTEYGACVTAAARLLRSGGVLLLHAMLGPGREVYALRDVALEVRDSELWMPAMLPVGEGLLAAVRV
jgi:predicted O-methyltransferase YrrM